jgi:hypothetical protein
MTRHDRFRANPGRGCFATPNPYCAGSAQMTVSAIRDSKAANQVPEWFAVPQAASTQDGFTRACGGYRHPGYGDQGLLARSAQEMRNRVRRAPPSHRARQWDRQTHRAAAAGSEQEYGYAR